MKTNKIEYRSFELTSTISEDKVISGLAIPINSRSALLGDFYEIISPSAVNDQLILNNDVRLLYDHDPSFGSLGRSKYGEGTLHLSIEDDGLHFECQLPDTSFGKMVYEGLRRNEIDAVSFGFYVGEDNWEQNLDGTYTRTILSIDKLVECSILDVAPAYSSTEVALRSLEEFKQQEEEKKAQIIAKLDVQLNEINELCKI